MKAELMNTNVLAYLGDSIFEVYVRRYLIESGIIKPHLLQKASIKFVSAKAQASFVKYLLENNLLTEQEIQVYKRGRNTKSKSIAKNTDVVTYQMATGFEALIGMLDIEKKEDRILELFEIFVEKMTQ